MFVEQAIFTSARSERASGYHLVAASPGIDEADARELAAWGPSHDSLVDTGSSAVSVNFHRLPSGAFAVSQSTPEGPEFSGRGGVRVYTQSLVVSAEGLARFANNPFAVLRAALAHGVIRVHEKLPRRLEAFELPGRAAVVDEGAIEQAAGWLGAARLAGVVAAVLEHPSLVLSCDRLRPRLVAALLACLPSDCRADLTFTTGLKFSPRRPFRIHSLPRDSVELRRLERHFGLQSWDAEGDPATGTTPGWPGLIAWVIETKHIREFARELGRLRPGVSRSDLPDLAHRIRSQIESARPSHAPPVRPGDSRWAPSATDGLELASRAAPARPAAVNGASDHRSDGRHSPRQPASRAGVGRAAVHDIEFPSERLAQRLQGAAPQLEALEDLIFEALAGKLPAVASLQESWVKTLADLDPATVIELREGYLRFTLALWRQLGDDDPALHHRRATAVLDIVGLLVE